MEKRRFGRTKHISTVAVFGGVALGQLDQSMADIVIQQVIDAGVNHIDIAPSYGEAELRLGPWMPKIRDDVFLGCKTTERTKQGAIAEFHQSLERLQVDAFDLYQLHAVTTMEELDQCTRAGGSLEGVIEMRDQGLTRFIGITGHGMQTPAIFIEALRRFDFDTVLFPIFPALFTDEDYHRQALALLDLCEEKDVGVMTIKAIAKGPWGDREPHFHTWYEPFDDQETIQTMVNFSLSQKLAHICTVGDYRILGKVLNACEKFEPMDAAAQEALIQEQSERELIF
jgi:aryl-alcohol dehydrogenase-like predicted oxidoreductase